MPHDPQNSPNAVSPPPPSPLRSTSVSFHCWSTMSVISPCLSATKFCLSYVVFIETDPQQPGGRESALRFRCRLVTTAGPPRATSSASELIRRQPSNTALAAPPVYMSITGTDPSRVNTLTTCESQIRVLGT